MRSWFQGGQNQGSIQQGLLGLRIFKLLASLQVQQHVVEHKSLPYHNPT